MLFQGACNWLLNAPPTANLGRHLGHGLHIRDRSLHFSNTPTQIYASQIEAGRFARECFQVVSLIEDDDDIGPVDLRQGI